MACRTSTRRPSGESTSSSSRATGSRSTASNSHRDIVNELEYNLLLCDTGKLRLSSNIIADQVGRYERHEQGTVDAMRELKRLTIEMKDRLLRREWDDFAHLLHEEWQTKKRMSDRISNPALDDLYDLALSEGAVGGKITGAGGGGFMLLWCGFGRKHKVADALKARGCDVSEVALEPFGLQTWRVG